MHRIATEMEWLYEYVGDEKAVELIAKAGFDGFDYSLFKMTQFDWKNGKGYLRENHPLNSPDYVKHCHKLRRIAEDNGICCIQSHAPFPVADELFRTLLFKSIEITAEVGGKLIVIHPNNDASVEQNRDMYLELLPFAKECGVKIAAENMWNWDWENERALPAACSTARSFVDHIDAVNDDNLVACLDIGHAEMMKDGTNAVDLILALNHRLQALHIHDNDKIHDRHQIPFSMDIQFEPIIKALQKIDYKGDFDFETIGYAADLKGNDLLGGLKRLCAVARQFVDKFNNKE
ncbi:MAG: sugar phosphate isomerase/epimerase [Clostridia bacterium]|nr:sugar phosphate isomerase/epimerase [Clostridia bacterium]MBQ6980063.1 sugar phosphate isomerase/epimerase [Clostridia bacterium]MBQ9513793.1 sugar phosphate isomerase/epimerase [Clostridia bacterium]